MAIKSQSAAEVEIFDSEIRIVKIHTFLDEDEVNRVIFLTPKCVFGYFLAAKFQNLSQHENLVRPPRDLNL